MAHLNDPWPCGHNDPVYAGHLWQSCAICHETRDLIDDQEVISNDDYILADAAMAVAGTSNTMAICLLLMKECNWSHAKALAMINRVRAAG